MSDVLAQLKSDLKATQAQLRDFKSLSESEKNRWYGPLFLVSWAIIAMLVGPSEPRESLYGLTDLNQYFSFIGGLWFLLVLILVASAAVVMKKTWIRYVLGAIIFLHLLFYVSYIPEYSRYSSEKDTYEFIDSSISLFSGSLRAGLLFELIPLAGALMTIRLESAQWMRIRTSRIVPAIRKWIKQVAGSTNQSSASGSASGDVLSVDMAAANRAWRASRIVEVFGWFNIVVGVIAGIILIVLGFKGGSCTSSYDECATDGTYVGIGFGVMFACVIQGSFFVMIGAFIASRTATRSRFE